MATSDATTREFQAEMAAIRDDLAALRDDIAAIAHTAAQAASDGPVEISETVRQKAEEFGIKGSEFVSSVGREIEQRPLASVAVAFGVGFLIGKLLDRRAENGVTGNGKTNG